MATGGLVLLVEVRSGVVVEDGGGSRVGYSWAGVDQKWKLDEKLWVLIRRRRW